MFVAATPRIFANTTSFGRQKLCYKSIFRPNMNFYVYTICALFIIVSQSTSFHVTVIRRNAADLLKYRWHTTLKNMNSMTRSKIYSIV